MQTVADDAGGEKRSAVKDSKRTAPVTRFYQVRVAGGYEWARIWITDDGCFTTISDYGNYGYWWGSPGCEFRKFLTEVDDDYLMGKLSYGQDDEIDEERTKRLIKEAILRYRRDGHFTKEQAQAEWDLLRHTDVDSEYDRHVWYHQTKLEDAAELFSYQRPIQVQMFVKKLWPLFVAELKKELENE